MARRIPSVPRAALWLAGPAVVLAVLAGVMLAWDQPAPPAADRMLTPITGWDDNAPLRLTVTGTSLTARYDWPVDLARHVEACSGRPVALTVIARGGAASDWGASQAAALAASRPHIALVEFTINDADLRRRVSLQASRRHHERIVAALRGAAPEARIVLVTLNRARGLRAVLRPRIAAYEAQYDALADRLDLGRLGLGPDWAHALAAGDPRVLIPDGLHPAPLAVTRHALPRIVAHVAALAGCPPP